MSNEQEQVTITLFCFCTFTVLPQESLIVPLDTVKFKLVIQNLLSNAIKFTEEGGNINVSLKDHNGQVVVDFEDDGIGIHGNKLGKLFEKFSDARRKGLHGEKSTGLGLSITKKIVDLHGGRIEVQSEEGEGTRFMVYLPKK